jgi:hypothetical protein
VLECELDDDCLDLRRVAIRPGAGVEGRSLGELDLAGLGLEPVALERGGGRLDPLPGYTLIAGDRLDLRGAPTAFDAAAELFRSAYDEPLALPRAPTPPTRGIDTQAEVRFDPAPDACAHAAGLRPVLPSAAGCEECLAAGKGWVHLRICLACGHVGCCDASEGKHATAHWEATTHPLIRSLEPGERWAWCYLDQRELDPGQAVTTA